MKIANKGKRAAALILAALLCFAGVGGSGAVGAMEPPEPKKYTVMVEACENGSLKLDVPEDTPYLFARGESVRVSIKPEPGWKLEELTVSDGKGNIVAREAEEDTAVFSMPGADVTVFAVFSASGEGPLKGAGEEPSEKGGKGSSEGTGKKTGGDPGKWGAVSGGTEEAVSGSEKAGAKKGAADSVPEEGAVSGEDGETDRKDGEAGREKEVVRKENIKTPTGAASGEGDGGTVHEGRRSPEKGGNGASPQEGVDVPTEEAVRQALANHMDILEGLERGESALLSMLSPLSSGEEVDLQVTAKDFYGYGAYGLGTWGTRRWEIVFEDPETGDERTVYAYCIQPKKNRPGDCTAKLERLSDNKLISKVIWAGNSAYSGEGSFWNCARRYGWMKGSHWECARDYGWADGPDGGAQWIITHIAASKAGGDKDWDYGANDSARKLAQELIAFASDSEYTLAYPEISFSETDVTARTAEPGDWKTGDRKPLILKEVKACRQLVQSGAYQKTPGIRVRGSFNNTIRFTAPKNVYCFEMDGDCYGDPADFEVLTDGKIRYTVRTNSEICFIAPLDQTEAVSAVFRFTAQGAVKKVFTPYKLTISGPGDYQNLCMIMGTAVPAGEREATMTVRWLTAGELHIEKKDGRDGALLAGAAFRLLDGEGKAVVPTRQNGITGDIEASGLITVRGDGRADVGNIPAGVYRLREIHVPAGYRASGEEAPVKITPGGKTAITVFNEQTAAGIRIRKYDADTGKPAAQGGATFEKARFRIIALQDCKVGAVRYKSGSIVYEDLLLDRDGCGETPDNVLTEGRYRLEETHAPEGYRIGDRVEFTIEKSDHGKLKNLTVGEVADPPVRGGVKIKKVDADTKEGAAQGNASLAGARFDIINLSANPVQVGGATYGCNETVYTMRTGADGTARTDTRLLPYGSYAVREAAGGEPEGYLWNGDNYRTFSVGRDGILVDLSGEPMEDPVIRGGVRVLKYDGQSLENRPLGGASLENMEIAVYNESRGAVRVFGQVYQPGEIVHVMRTDAEGCAQTPADLLPCGTYRLVETAPPEGYLGRGEDGRGVYERTVDITRDGEVVDCAGGEGGMIDFVKRGDFSIRKIRSDTQRSMAGVAFRVTSVTTGEAHEFMTDANGFYSTASSYTPHSRNTNGGRLRDGMWFGLGTGGENVEADDSLGALPYDTYQIEELPGENNRGMAMFSDKFTVSEDGELIELGNIENAEISIGTKARDSLTGSQCQAAGEEVCIVDTVFYQNLKKGVSYTLKGTLVKRDTGEVLKDAKGNTISAEKVFRPAVPTGSADVEFTFDASGFGGMAVVVFEELYEGNKKLAEHKDIEDEDQTIRYPEIVTRAADRKTSTNVSHAESEVALTDTVSYTGLKAGQVYRLTGTLMVKETGEAYVDGDGRPVAASRSFVPEGPSGTEKIVFTFDGRNAVGRTLVVFEELSKDGQTYAVHRDLADESQSVHFPGLETRARVESTGEQVAMAAMPLAVTDTVSYSGLKPGQEYRLRGSLMAKDTGRPLEEAGIPVAAERVFVPDSPSGTVDMRFAVNGKKLPGGPIVVFEELYMGNRLVASHRDIESASQTVYIPEIHTTALDGATKTHEAKAAGEMTITDTVSYKNLMPGKAYRVTGILMDQETGKAVKAQGREVIAEARFEPADTEGAVDVTFRFDGRRLAGKTVVVFESLLYQDMEIASHRDIRDGGQSVDIVSVKSVKGVSVDKEKRKTDGRPSGRNGVSANAAGAVKTGDGSGVLLWGVAGLVSLGILALLLWRGRACRKMKPWR